MNITDRNIRYKRQTMYIPVTQFRNGGAQSLTIDQLEGSSAMWGIKVTTTGTLYRFSRKVPPKMHPDFPLGMRLHFTTVGTTLGNLTFSTKFEPRDIATAFGTSFSADFDTTLATIAAGTEKLSKFTARAIKNAGWTTYQKLLDGLVFQGDVGLSAVSGTIDASNYILLLGVEFDFVPWHTQFPLAEIDAPFNSGIIPA